MNINRIHKKSISIFLIWLFNFSGIIGILIGYQDWFLSLTPLNLLVYLTLIFWNEGINSKLIWVLSIPFLIGMITEFLGVNYGWIFGSYQYGENLGYKIQGVPLMIGVNWAVLTYCTATIAKRIHKNIIISSIIASILMVLLDLIIEIVAPKFDFWEFEKGIVPLQNYIGWFGVAFIAHLGFQKLYKPKAITIATHIFVAITMFFLVFLFF